MSAITIWIWSIKPMKRFAIATVALILWGLSPANADVGACDGSTDDTAAINTALSAGGTVMLNPGVCRINAGLVDSSGATVKTICGNLGATSSGC